MRLRQSLRGLLRTPAFTASTIATLALGIGANTGAFSALNALVLRPLPYPEPQRLVALHETTPAHKPREVAEQNLLDWRARSTLFEAMSVYRPRSFGLTLGESDPVTVIQTGMVMADFFRVAGVAPAMGRAFSEEEEIGERLVMVLTDRLWREKFGADRGAIGRGVRLNEDEYTVIGVMPAEFEFPMDRTLPDAFIPLSRKLYCCGRLGPLLAAGRMKPGARLEQARAEIESIGAALASEYPATNRGRTAGVEPLERAMTGARKEPLALLAAASLALLLIACANVAGLMLARWTARGREIAVKAALGAGAGRLAKEFLGEAAILALAGASCGMPAALAALRAIPALLPGAPLREPPALDGAAFGFALLAASAVTLILGLAPAALARRADLNTLIKSGGWQIAGAGRSGARSWLVVTQVALSVVLLLSAGVLLRSFARLATMQPGFETAHAIQFGIGLPEKRYDTELKLIDFHRDLLSKLRALPGVSDVGAARSFPLTGAASIGASFQIAGESTPLLERQRTLPNIASPGYFAAMGIPLVEGREFSWQDDRPRQRRVAIVNQAFARAYLRGRRALGMRIELHFGTDLNPIDSAWEIVGVTADTRQERMEREPAPELFLPMSQTGLEGCHYVVRTRGNPAGMERAIVAAVWQQDPRLERVRPRPLELVVTRSLASRGSMLSLTGAFGGLALLLTTVGIYGMVAFRAAQRTREMAIRMALGATAGDVSGLVTGHGMRLAAAGVTAGIIAFQPASRLLQSQLYGVASSDALTITLVAAAALGAAWMASLGPSLRAGRIAPVELLRDDG